MALKQLTQKQDKVDLSKCYVRALIDDDTYCTTFGRWRDNQLEWQDAIFLPLKQRDLSETSIFVMVCINTEAEISFIDTMLANVKNYPFDYNRLV